MNTGTTVMLGIGPDQDSASEIKYKYVKKKKVKNNEIVEIGISRTQYVTVHGDVVVVIVW